MSLKNADYYVTKGTKIIINGIQSFLEGDMCCVLDGKEVKKIQKTKNNPLLNLGKYMVIKSAIGIIRVRVADLLTEQ